MRYHEFLPEASPDTPAGSITPDLLRSKVWLCHSLIQLGLTDFRRIYILGSWYGALALIIRRLPFRYHSIICVDSDSSKADYLSGLIGRHEISGVRSWCQRAEEVDYRPGRNLVINTSTNDMRGTEWLRRIPRGTVVAIQGRSNQEDSNGIITLERFNQAYPLAQTFMAAEITVEGVDGESYQRFMRIGRV